MQQINLTEIFSAKQTKLRAIKADVSLKFQANKNRNSETEKSETDFTRSNTNNKNSRKNSTNSDNKIDKSNEPSKQTSILRHEQQARLNKKFHSERSQSVSNQDNSENNQKFDINNQAFEAKLRQISNQKNQNIKSPLRTESDSPAKRQESLNKTQNDESGLDASEGSLEKEMARIEAILEKLGISIPPEKLQNLEFLGKLSQALDKVTEQIEVCENSILENSNTQELSKLKELWTDLIERFSAKPENDSSKHLVALSGKDTLLLGELKKVLDQFTSLIKENPQSNINNGIPSTNQEMFTEFKTSDKQIFRPEPFLVQLQSSLSKGNDQGTIRSANEFSQIIDLESDRKESDSEFRVLQEDLPENFNETNENQEDALFSKQFVRNPDPGIWNEIPEHESVEMNDKLGFQSLIDAMKNPGALHVAAARSGLVPRSMAEPQVMQQLLQQMGSMVLKAENQLEIQLKPEHLGRLHISLITENNHMSGQILVENEAVKQMLDDKLPQLRDALQAQGLQIDQLKVSIGEGKNFQFRENQQQNNKQNSSNASVTEENSVNSNTGFPDDGFNDTGRRLGYNTLEFIG